MGPGDVPGDGFFQWLVILTVKNFILAQNDVEIFQTCSCFQQPMQQGAQDLLQQERGYLFVGCKDY